MSRDNTAVATVDKSGTVTAVGPGNATITVKTINSGLTATCSVSVANMNILEPEAVDMGLSVRWATFNVGASKPEDRGYYYQWAGTRDVSNTDIYLDWTTCPFHTGSNESTGWTKYIPSDKPSYWSGKGSPDNKTILSPEDDAAYIAFGGRWRIPTKDEWQELIDNCDAVWTVLNGVGGRKFTSRKAGCTDKWIFLPIAGFRSYDRFYCPTSEGYYCSSSLYQSHPYESYVFYFTDVLMETDWCTERWHGVPVRPVLSK